MQKRALELQATLQKIEADLASLEKSFAIANRSLRLNRQLRDAAKKAYTLGSMLVEEYLRYEDELAAAYAAVAQIEAQKRALLAQKAFIYGIDLKRIFQ